MQQAFYLLPLLKSVCLAAANKMGTQVESDKWLWCGMFASVHYFFINCPKRMQCKSPFTLPYFHAFTLHRAGPRHCAAWVQE